MIPVFGEQTLEPAGAAPTVDFTVRRQATALAPSGDDGAQPEPRWRARLSGFV
jgi:hypothetical protein